MTVGGGTGRIAAAVAIVGATTIAAAASPAAPTGRPDLGGGFIEFLVTGAVPASPGPARALARMSGDTVPYDGPLAPGAIIVDPKRRLKYRVLPGGQAERRPMRSALDMSWAER